MDLPLSSISAANMLIGRAKIGFGPNSSVSSGVG